MHNQPTLQQQRSSNPMNSRNSNPIAGGNNASQTLRSVELLTDEAAILVIRYYSSINF